MDDSKRYSGRGSSRPGISLNNLEDRLIVKESESQLPNEECKKELPLFLTYTSSLIHLAVFGILGVLSRYLLEKLFGPEMIGLTSDDSFLYVDLPPNMVGSFLMGWIGVVFKEDISKFSNQLAVGLSTGCLGSLTTFSGWNQKMFELSVEGHWVYCIIGFLLGLFLAYISFKMGVLTATCFKRALSKTNLCGFSEINNNMRQILLIIVMVTMLGLEWGLSVALLIKDFDGVSSTSHLWFGCIVGPIGVWIRFYLSKLNGKGLGRTESMKWMPFGTLIANVAACCIMAAFATVKKDVNDKHFDIVAKGIQFGLCGCLSTVSTYIAEFGAMIEKGLYWQACVYTFTTIIISFSLCTLIYSVPVWTKGWL